MNQLPLLEEALKAHTNKYSLLNDSNRSKIKSRIASRTNFHFNVQLLPKIQTRSKSLAFSFTHLSIESSVLQVKWVLSSGIKNLAERRVLIKCLSIQKRYNDGSSRQIVRSTSKRMNWATSLWMKDKWRTNLADGSNTSMFWNVWRNCSKNSLLTTRIGPYKWRQNEDDTSQEIIFRIMNRVNTSNELSAIPSRCNLWASSDRFQWGVVTVDFWRKSSGVSLATPSSSIW